MGKGRARSPTELFGGTAVTVPVSPANAALTELAHLPVRSDVQQTPFYRSAEA
jgi:hypothetical protein